MRYLHRQLEPMLRQYCKRFSVVGLTGPRQSGKSTLLQHVLTDYEYVTFDNHKTLEHFNNDPEGFIQRYADRIIFDEAQKCPDLFDYIKLAVDNDRHNKGKFVITGSSQFTILNNITESLAGRIGHLQLLPFQYAEIPTQYRDISLLKGCYPELLDWHYEDSEQWYDSYLTTYLERDVRSISNIVNLADFQRLLRLLAANVSQQLNLQTYAKQLGVSASTIKHWLSVLEASYVIFLLPPFYENFGKRITKAPKLYFYDVGLVNYLVGIRDQQHLDNGPMAGAIFENYIVSDVLKQQLHHKTLHKLYYFRDSNQTEIDLIIDKSQSLDLIEIKHTSTFKTNYVKPMQRLLRAEDNGYLIYRGETYQYNDDIKAVNYAAYLSENSDNKPLFK